MTFDPEDFNPEIYETIGVISADTVNGWKRLNITDAYLSNLSQGRPYCQLMLKFDILTDYDRWSDLIEFGSSYADEYPYILVYYSSPNSNDDEHLIINKSIDVYPNPFKDRCSLVVSTDKQQKVEIAVHNIKGQLVKSLNSTNQKRGSDTYACDGTDNSGLKASAGIYMFRVKAGNSIQIRKVILIK